ncbi:MAG: YcaO-like family protein [Thermodesulfobacteriota bacterium]
MSNAVKIDLAETLKSRTVRRVISRKVGIIKSVYLIPIDNDDPKVFLAASELCDARYLGAGFEYSRNGGGAALTEEEAIFATVGEAIERYCAIVASSSNSIFGSYDEVCPYYSVVHPEKFALYSTRQYEKVPFTPFSRKTRVSWCRGLSLMSGKETYVPEQRVYMHFISDHKQDNLGHVTTTGLASGRTMKEAVLAGLLECLERDAFAIFWLNRLPVEIYDLKSSNRTDEGLAGLISEKFLADRHEYIVARLPTDHDIPVFCCVLVTLPPCGPKRVLSVGAACRIRPQEAVLKAMIEAVQGKSFILQQISKNPDWQAERDFSNVISFDIHTQLYTRHPEIEHVLLGIKDNVSRKRTVDELGDDPNEIGNREIDDQLSCILHMLQGKGYEAFVVDLTTPDVFALGMRAVRVLVPELVQLHGDHRYPFLGSRRIYHVPEMLGCGKKTEAELNRYPHPFP